MPPRREALKKPYNKGFIHVFEFTYPNSDIEFSIPTIGAFTPARLFFVTKCDRVQVIYSGDGILDTGCLDINYQQVSCRPSII